MKKEIIITLLVLTLALAGCTSVKNTTLQITGAETVTEWQSIGLECRTTRDCIDESLNQGASMQEIEGKLRCNKNVCESLVEKRIKTAELD